MNPDDLKIAVVESNETRRELLKRFLVAPGRRFFEANCAKELAKLLHRQRIDILILDVDLPGEDGFSIAQWVRVDWPEMRIVMLSARPGPADRASANLLGVDAFVVKPTTALELEGLVRNFSEAIPRRRAS